MNKFQLYQSVFGDSDAFVDFYFNRRQNAAKSYQKLIKNQTVGLVNVLDLPFVYDGQEQKYALISGLCTAPDMRKQGVMSSLLTEVLLRLQQQGYDAAILSPVDDNYYKKFGFEALSRANFVTINYTPCKQFCSKPCSEGDKQLLIEMYNNFAKNYKCHQLLSEKTLNDLIFEAKLSNTDIQIVYKNNTPIGWYFADNNVVEIAILPSLNILNNIRNLDGYKYWEYCDNGEKELFQIKTFNDTLKTQINQTFILNKY